MSARALAGVAAAALLCHGVSLWGGWIWLDHAHIEAGLGLVHGSPLSAFTGGFAGTGYYRPLVTLSLSLDAFLGGSALGYHATTLVLHALAAACVCLAAEALGLPARAAQLAGLAFAVHPAGAVVASAIAFRSESMALVALCAMVICHARGRVLGAALALAWGGLCKETALVLGPAFALLAVPPPPARRARLWAAEAAALLCVLGLRAAYAPPYRAAFPALSWGEAIATRLSVLAHTFATLLAPVPAALAVCDSTEVVPLASGNAWVGALCLAVSALWAVRGGPIARLFALSLLPGLWLVPLARVWSPHYAYLPLAFLCTGGASWLAQRLPSARALIVAAPLVVGAAVISARRDRDFASDAALWPAEAARAPGCREAQFYLGELARGQARWAEAAAHYRAALAGVPGVLAYVDRRAAAQQLGGVLLEQRAYGEAERAFRDALALTEEGHEARRARHNLATAQLLGGDPDAALGTLADDVARSDALLASLVLAAKAHRALGQRERVNALLPRILAARARGEVLSAAP